MGKALVTGGGRGIGRAIALELADAGFDVTVAFSRSQDAADEVVSQIQERGRSAEAVQVDLRRLDEIHAAIERIWADHGPYEVLVNNAGAHNRTPFLEMTPEKWSAVIDLDLTAPAYVSHQFAQCLVAQGGGGSILNIGSINGLIAYPNLTHYCAAKGGLHMLTRAMALELAPHGIRVNAIAPGLIDTDLTKAITASPELLRGKLDRIPLERTGQPQDVARLARYMLDGSSEWMTGNVVVLDGGQHIH
jgi:NAD(P)-dependent dehydrogenase (short-subunit alcohol dehydrogenase family)